MKSESLILIIAVVCIGGAALRWGASEPSAANRQTSLAVESEQILSSIEEPKPSVVSKDQDGVVKTKTLPIQNATQATKKISESQHEIMLAYYRKLKSLPGMEFYRLQWIEKMVKGPFSEKEILKFVLSEVALNRPQQDFTPAENERRRTASSIAYSLFLENCSQFDTCHEAAIGAVMQMPDAQLQSELIQSLFAHYPEDWQKERVLAQFRRYGVNYKIYDRAPATTQTR